MERLVPIRQEFEAVRAATAHTLTAPDRLFSEFEGVLIDWMGALRPRRPIPRTAERLIDRVAGLAHVPDPPRLGAHAVRNYRNSVVHAGAMTAPVVSFRQAFSALSRFLSMLP